MPKEILESTYECDCGHQLHFCISTVSELKAKSMKRKQYLAETDEHWIVFDKGKMVEILCPRQKETRARGSTQTKKSHKDV